MIFLLGQVISSVLLVVIGMLLSPGFKAAAIAYLSGSEQEVPLFDQIPVSFFALTLMAANILTVLACYYLLRNIRLVTASDFASIKWRPGMLGIAGGVLGAISMSVLTENVELPDMMKQMSIAMSHNVWGLLALTIIGPISEELIFREAIEGEMLRRGASPWTAIIVSTLAFSAAHLNLAQSLYALPLGILFGIIYYKTGNIILAALLHILNNSIAAIQLHNMGENYEDTSYADWLGSTSATYAIMAFCGVLCLVLTKFFWDYYCPSKETKKQQYLT